ncbi:MAG TPA: hypothetical protein DHU86_06760 [Polaribacter sp.]|nr:hypothetical protein [Polaribacter sp.]
MLFFIGTLVTAKLVQLLKIFVTHFNELKCKLYKPNLPSIIGDIQYQNKVYNSNMVKFKSSGFNASFKD